MLVVTVSALVIVLACFCWFTAAFLVAAVVAAVVALVVAFVGTVVPAFLS